MGVTGVAGSGIELFRPMEPDLDRNIINLLAHGEKFYLSMTKILFQKYQD